MPVIKVPVMQLPRPAAPQIIPLQPQPTPASTAPAANQAPAKTASQ
jgi:hypothetical protein